jgi:DnaK suppressor protein
LKDYGGTPRSQFLEKQHTDADAPVVLLAPDYKPGDDEEFMNPMMLEYFRQRLLRWRDEIIAESAETISNLQEEAVNEPDLADRATSEINRSFELRTRDRGRKLLIKIDEALERINDKSYGYCEKTGDPIGIGRLEARPIATLSLEAQEMHEKSERLHSD